MTDYKFTQDWFSHNIPVWEQLKGLLSGEPGERGFLEIGSFEGRSMVWIAENMMQDGDSIDCVDTWEGSEEHKNGELNGAEERFDYNLALIERRCPEKWVIKNKNTSTKSLANWLDGGDAAPTYDFIYIDGSHIAKDVLTDACMAWPLLKQGGLMVFDDYLWGESRDILHRPRLAVDFFVNIFAESLDIVHIGHQFVVRKK
jgi:predicted O-methyltransferase YrrM